MEFAMASRLSRQKEKLPQFASKQHARPKEVIDLHGNYLAPGFIDLHVHGALGRDTMEASAEAFRLDLQFPCERRHDFASAYHSNGADGQAR